MATVTLTITAEDFDKLTTSSMRWGKDWLIHQRRFEPTIINFSYHFAYWIDTYLEALFCQHYISGLGYESETHWDTAMAQWIILTNYESGDWK